MSDLPNTGATGAIGARNPSLSDLIVERYSRRDALRGGASATAMAVVGSTLLAACGGGGDDNGGADGGGAAPTVSISGGGGSVTAGTRVMLTGTANGSGTLTTEFLQVAGTSVTLSATKNATTTSFIAPTVTRAETVVIRFRAVDDSKREGLADANITVNPAVLSFAAVAKNRLDVVTIPAGHSLAVLHRLGDPLNSGLGAYRNDGSDASFSGRIGDHHASLRFFGLRETELVRDDQASTRGLLAVNHQSVTQAYLHPGGPTAPGGARPENEALKEIEAHGISVSEVASTSGVWSYVASSDRNRRQTPNVSVAINGPVRGAGLLQTAFSNDGTTARGTIGNGANGFTPWGTFLSCEEGWASYFRRPPATDNSRRSAKEVASLSRYGVTSNAGTFGWATVVPGDASDTRYRRWDAQATGSSATADYRNEPNHFGWVVELDPYDGGRQPRKRTALGRLHHGGIWPGLFVAGRKPGFYISDAGQNEYLYKFVSDTVWDLADAGKDDRLGSGDKYLDKGTLYVAVFKVDGSGTWVPLTFNTGNITTANGTYSFADQADVLANARIAADVSSATRLDSPSRVSVNPNATGEVYLALNGNDTRTNTNTDGPNPRSYRDAPSTMFGNRNGHVLRLLEAGASTEATTFTWDIALFGAGADLNATDINVSGLVDTNDFSGPKSLGFARPANPPTNATGGVTPLLWIQTDDTAYRDVTNNQMLASIAGTIGDGGTSASRFIKNYDVTTNFTNQATIVGKAATADTIKRFLVGPVECAVTGVDSTPDGKTLFVSIQHPGLNGSAAAPTSNWPSSQSGAAPGSRPRSATIVIQRTDGGVVGL